MTVSPDAESVIRDLVREAMQDIPVTDIEITEDTEDTDQDDDPILRVLVVCDAPETAPAGRRGVGLTRHPRRKLATPGEERFPLVAFVSAADRADA